MISVLLVLEDTVVSGLDVAELSSYPHESEVLLAGVRLRVLNRVNDVLQVGLCL